MFYQHEDRCTNEWIQLAVEELIARGLYVTPFSVIEFLGCKCHPLEVKRLLDNIKSQNGFDDRNFLIELIDRRLDERLMALKLSQNEAKKSLEL